jgi:PAS domain S-box-containing protein
MTSDHLSPTTVDEQVHADRARLAALVESSYDAIIGKNLDGTITAWNRGAERMYGYTADEAVGRSIAFILPQDRVEEVHRILAELKRGKRVEKLETIRVTKDGRLLHVALTISPVFDTSGKPTAAVTVARDITEQKRSEEQLRALNETLERRVAERTAEAERRATQLRALTAELTQAEERERRRLAQTLHDHLQQLLVAGRLKLGPLRRRLDKTLQPAIDQVDRLLAEAIDASRSLTVELSPPVLYDGGLIAALEWLARHMMEKQNLKVKVHAQTEAEPASDGMRSLLFQCVRELLFNVVKHAHTDSAAVDVTRADDGFIRVTVSDNGGGFDPRALEEEGAWTCRDGFGLFSIRERIDPVGGRLQIVSAPGRGTRISVALPSEDPADEAQPLVHEHLARAEKPAPYERSRRPAVDTGKVRVLLADDHEIFRQGLASLLWEEPDIELVGQAGDGVDAVELALKTRPDVVLMDITMPRLNGIDATRRITAEMPDVRVIGLSMHEKQDMAEAMRDAGAEAYFPKGVASDAIIAAIRGAGESSAVGS